MKWFIYLFETDELFKKVNSIFIINFTIQNNLFLYFRIYIFFMNEVKILLLIQKRWLIVIVDIKTNDVELSFKV